jgi:hypothetical protein
MIKMTLADSGGLSSRLRLLVRILGLLVRTLMGIGTHPKMISRQLGAGSWEDRGEKWKNALNARTASRTYSCGRAMRRKGNNKRRFFS